MRPPIIVSHQHPSGDPTPSREDIEVTKRLSEAGKIMGVEVLDHIIVTDTGRHNSLKEKDICKNRGKGLPPLPAGDFTNGGKNIRFFLD
jgi:hypothetical protein